MAFNYGHIDPFWNIEEVKAFPYQRQPLMDYEIDNWRSQGYDYVKSFSGQMYGSNNPMPKWVKHFEYYFQNDHHKFTYNFYKMQTLEIMPTHSDHYQTYMKVFDVDFKDCIRILVMLEDWKPGHYLEIDGEGITNWKAGDWFSWRSGALHAAANIGIEDRYTLQITASEIHGTKDTYGKLHWYNLSDLKTKNVSKKCAFMKYYIKRVLNVSSDFSDDIDKMPTYVYMNNGIIKELGEISHSPDMSDYYNKVGIRFYLYEPLCSYLESSDKNNYLGVKSEFTSDINPSELRAYELDSIQEYADRNKLTNVTVYTGDYEAEKWYPHYSINLKYDDIFVNTLERPKDIETVAPVNSSKINKKFICLNWRHTIHRHLTAAFLSKRDVYLSWYFMMDTDKLVEIDWLNLENFKYKQDVTEGLAVLNDKGPFTVDLNTVNHNQVEDIKVAFYPNQYDTIFDYIGVYNLDISKYYDEVFCSIVTESRYAQPTGNFSEKILNTIWHKKPFIVVAPPHTLKAFKSYGYKTFSDFWDESYDDCYDHQERLTKIFDLINYIDSQSIETLKEWYVQMQDILEYNLNLIKTKMPTRHEIYSRIRK